MAGEKPYFSIIIPVYNRPDEVRELLESLVGQTCKDFELLLVEDGSTCRCDEVAGEYSDRLTIRYFYKENSGRSLTRNYGMERAEGRYLVFSTPIVLFPLLILRRCAVVSKRPMSTVTAVPMRLIVLFPGCKRPSIML